MRKFTAVTSNKSLEWQATGDVVYADPPYTTLGQNNGFIRYNEHLSTWRDQQRLASECICAAQRGAFVVVSSLWHESILGLYSKDGGRYASAGIQNASVHSPRREGGKYLEALLFSNKPSGTGAD